MTYRAVLRVSPLKEKDLKSCEKHQNRDNDELHIDKKKTVNNKILLGSKNLKDDIDNIVSKYKHHPNASICCEMILTANQEYFNQICPNWRNGEINDKLQNWIDVNVSFLKEKYPEIAGIRLHLDEQAPHLHAYIVPVDTYKIKYRRGEKIVTKIKYNNVFGDDFKQIAEARKQKNPELTKCGKLQTAYADYLKKHNIDLQRGVKNSRQTHTKIRDYHRIIKTDFSKYNIEKIIIKDKIENGLYFPDEQTKEKTEALYRILTAGNINKRLKEENKKMTEENNKLKEELANISLKYEQIKKEQLAFNRKISIEEMANFVGFTGNLQDEKGKYLWRNAVDFLIDKGQLSPRDAMIWITKQEHWNIDKIKNTINENTNNSIESIRQNDEVKPKLNYFQKQAYDHAKAQLIALKGNENSVFRITLMHRDKPSFNLGKRENEDEKFWNMEEVLSKIPYLLKQNNLEKYNIFITPFNDKYDFYLIDDMNKNNLENIEHDGLKVNVLCESSPGNMQGILFAEKDKNMTKETRNLIFKNLNLSHGDTQIVGQIHPFRLAGFHNVKPKHEKNGVFPLFSLSVNQYERFQRVLKLI